MKHRVAITGLGVVSPIGCSTDSFRENLLAGHSGVAVITSFDPQELPTRIAAEVKTPMPFGYRDRKIGFALEAARQAMAAASRRGAVPGSTKPATTTVRRPSEAVREAVSAFRTALEGRPAKTPANSGLSIGIGLEVLAMEDLVELRQRDWQAPQLSYSERLTFLQTPSDLCAHELSRCYCLDGPPLIHVSACAAGTDAIGAAFHEIRSGRRRWMLAGAADSMINPLGVGGFCKLRALSTSNATPPLASRPFDRARDGFVLGEGAGMLVLENFSDARERGAEIHGEVLGYGNSFDAHGISEPHPDGRGAWQAMSRALADAQLPREAVDAINAHGSSTPKNDVMETLAIKRLFGDRAKQIPVVSTKSMIGHLIAAAGAVEAIAAILGMQAGWLHPTINLTDPDPACDLDYVPQRARRYEQRIVMSNSFAFGGQNACILFGRGIE